MLQNIDTVKGFVNKTLNSSWNNLSHNKRGWIKSRFFTAKETLHTKGRDTYRRRGVLAAINLMGFTSRIYKELKKLNTYTQTKTPNNTISK